MRFVARAWIPSVFSSAPAATDQARLEALCGRWRGRKPRKHWEAAPAAEPRELFGLERRSVGLSTTPKETREPWRRLGEGIAALFRAETAPRVDADPHGVVDNPTDRR